MRRKKGTFPFFLWIGETISKRMMPANPVCGTNIKEPELAVKRMPQKQLRIP